MSDVVYTFYRLVVQSGVTTEVSVVGEAACGRTFVVGKIVDCQSANPCLVLRKPLGLDGVKAILDGWESVREEIQEVSDES